MESERGAPNYLETMRSTVTGPYRSGICYAHKDKKLGMIWDDYKIGDSLKGVETHEYGPATRSEINKVKYATTTT